MTQLERLQATLKESKFDALIISSPLNNRYLSDLSYTDGYLLIGAERAYLLADFRYIEVAKNTVKSFDVVMPEHGMLPCLAELIGENKWTSIGIEEASVSCADLARFESALPNNTKLLHGASAILSKQRSIKLPYEIERMDAAQKITDAAFTHILSYIRPEVTERDVALELEFFMRRMGAEGTAFETIAVSGPASSLPHGEPSDVKLRAGFLTMDFGAKYMGYCSDMTRTVVIGRADEDIKNVYNTVLKAQLTALDGICGGIACRAGDELARKVIRDAGYGKAFGHSLGHGVGVFVHENPRLAPSVPEGEVLVAGNVVTVEPGIYLEGKYGCRIEDMIAINEDGSVHNFTHSTKELIEL